MSTVCPACRGSHRADTSTRKRMTPTWWVRPPAGKGGSAVGLCGGTGGCCTFPVGGRSVEIKASKWKEKFCTKVSGATGPVHRQTHGRDVPTPGSYRVGCPWPLAFSVPARSSHSFTWKQLSPHLWGLSIYQGFW